MNINTKNFGFWCTNALEDLECKNLNTQNKWHSLVLITYTEFQKDERISKSEIYQNFGGLKPTLALLLRRPCS